MQEANGFLQLHQCQAGDGWSRVPRQLPDSGQGLCECTVIYGHEYLKKKKKEKVSTLFYSLNALLLGPVAPSAVQVWLHVS